MKVTDLRDLYYLKNLLKFEKEQMEEAGVSADFYEYETLCKWLQELEERIEKK
ncbi:hypothetical protein V4V35_25495 [Bacillus infantis]|uniref:hypothetical protein n=1 Tax=Bacillus infantis TaxID=324767 RepID=UPI002FBD5D76